MSIEIQSHDIVYYFTFGIIDIILLAKNVQLIPRLRCLFLNSQSSVTNRGGVPNEIPLPLDPIKLSFTFNEEKNP